MVQKRLRINKKERVLLLNSNVIEDYPWLKRLLEDNGGITQDIVNTLPKGQRDFFDHVLPRVNQQVVREWKGNEKHLVEDMGPNKDTWISCSICGQPNRLIFYIINILTERNLNVGSECIKKFGIDTARFRNLVELKKQAMRTRRLAILNETFPGINRTVEGWSRGLDKFALIVPGNLEKRYLDVGEKLRGLYESYLKEKVDDEVYGDIAQVLEDYRAIISDIEHYVASSSSERFVAGRDLGLWLERQGDRQVIEMIKEDAGRITWRTAHRIRYPDFMDSITPDFNRALTHIGLRLSNIDYDRGGYVIELLRQGSMIRLFCRHQPFVLKYGGILFDQELLAPLSLDTLVDMSSIYDEPSVELVLKELGEQTKGCGLDIWGYDYEFNEVVIRNSIGYVICDLRVLAEAFKPLALGLHRRTVEDLLSHVGLHGRPHSKDEIKELQANRGQRYLTL